MPWARVWRSAASHSTTMVEGRRWWWARFRAARVESACSIPASAAARSGPLGADCSHTSPSVASKASVVRG